MATSNTRIAQLVENLDNKLDQHIIDTADHEARMASMEKNMEKLTEAVIMIARVEQKIGVLEERREEQHERINRLSGKIDNIDSAVAGLVEKVNFGTRISWLVIAIFITAIATQLGLPT